MQSYHNSQAIKDKHINRMQAHMDADELVQGMTWKNNKGCAVGCTLDKYEHADYEIELGLPTWLAYLEDMLFEHVSKAYSKDFPLRFLKAIPPGITSSQFDIIRSRFLIFILNGNLKIVEDLDITDELKSEAIEAIRKCLNLQHNVTACKLIEAEIFAENAVDLAENAVDLAENTVDLAENAENAALWEVRSALFTVSPAVSSVVSVVNAALWAINYTESSTESSTEIFADELLVLLAA